MFNKDENQRWKWREKKKKKSQVGLSNIVIVRTYKIHWALKQDTVI